ncbi:hypothetical protein BTVI_38268 [Pitangus sulphuratus]|nr:hypothetical protein BTVI_38268 [Pitangus sulphuratus]
MAAPRPAHGCGSGALLGRFGVLLQALLALCAFSTLMRQFAQTYRSGSGNEVSKGGKALEQVAQRSCGCPIPGSVQGQLLITVTPSWLSAFEQLNPGAGRFLVSEGTSGLGELRNELARFYDTSKQAIGALFIHFANVFLSDLTEEDPCSLYLINFILDATLGMLLIWLGVKVVSWIVQHKKYTYLVFGEYVKNKFLLLLEFGSGFGGTKCLIHQAEFLVQVSGQNDHSGKVRKRLQNSDNFELHKVMEQMAKSGLLCGSVGLFPYLSTGHVSSADVPLTVEKIHSAFQRRCREVQSEKQEYLKLWKDKLQQILLGYIPNPQLELVLVMLVVPFIVNAIMFWVVDSLIMRKHKQKDTLDINGSIETPRVRRTEESQVLLSPDMDFDQSESDQDISGLHGTNQKMKQPSYQVVI